jgi:hypothetical protein
MTMSVTSGSLFVRVPVLSSTHGVDMGGGFQGGGVLEQQAALGAQAGADHDRGRRSQTKGVRAGDDHHGDGKQQRLLNRPADGQPDEEGARSQRASGAVEEDPGRVQDHRQAQDQEKTSSRKPKGAGTVKQITSRPIGDHSKIGMESSAATRNRLRMSRTIASIDIPACPPWPIAS